MAKGKITQYEVDSFSKQAVGVPGENQSGQILAGGVSKLAAALQQRQDASDTLTAMSQFGDYQFEYQTKKIDLQKQFQNDPARYPEAVREMASKLSDQYSKGAPGGVAKKFREFTTRSLVGDTDELVNWSNRRDQEIQIANIQNVKQNIALNAANVTSAAGLQAIMGDFAATHEVAQKFITPEADAELTKKYKAMAVENAMHAQIYAQPMSVRRDLENGAYNGILSPEEIAAYTSKARTALYNRYEDEYFRNIFMAQGKLLDLQKGMDEGSVKITDLIVEREAARANVGKTDGNGNAMVSPDYIKGLDNLIDVTMYAKMKFPMAAADRKEVLKNFDTSWDEYLQEKKTKGQHATEEDGPKELSLYSQLSTLYKNGVITKDDFDAKTNIMRTKLSLKQGQSARVKSFSEVVDQAGTVPMLWWRKPGDDVLSKGYQMIKDHVEKEYSNLDEEGRRDLKAQMLSQYHDQILSTPEGIIKGQKTEQEKSNFAHGLIFGRATEQGRTSGVLHANAQYSESGRTYRPGDISVANGVSKKFLGMENGKPKWHFVEGQIITNTRGQKAKVLADGTFEVIENGR